MTPTLLAVDDLDDRRELHTLLHKLHPRKRVRFVAWCCAAVTRPRQSAPVVTTDEQWVRDAERCERGDDRLTNACYLDVLSLGSQWNLDMPRAAKVLEEFVRRGELPPARPSHPETVTRTRRHPESCPR